MRVDAKELIRVLTESKPYRVVDFDVATDRLFHLTLTQENTALTPELLSDTDIFSKWIEQQIASNHARYAIGGYNEHRTIYARSEHFGEMTNEEPRRLHLGTDIWGPAGTAVYNVFDGTVFGFANNDHFGDYGATIIMRYRIKGLEFYILYGHLSFASLAGLHEGKEIKKGEKVAEFGVAAENGHWPPHLHFQIITDMQGNQSDYPGVCKYSLRNEFLNNCPDPMLILNHGFTHV